MTPSSAVLLEAGLWTDQPADRDPWVSYLAPECGPGDDRGPAADLFSFGCVLARALDVAGPHKGVATLVLQMTAEDPSVRPRASDAVLVLPGNRKPTIDRPVDTNFFIRGE